MTTPPATPNTNIRIVGIVFSLLLIMTMLGVSLSTASDLGLGEAGPVTTELNLDERTYYEYVAPRLDRLILEVDDVVILVDGKSRDIIALTVSGERIDSLTTEIIDFGEENEVPRRFANIHRLTVNGSETVDYTFDEAKSALRRFNFSEMITLVSKFNDAADTLHQAQDEMRSIVGTSSTAVTACTRFQA